MEKPKKTPLVWWGLVLSALSLGCGHVLEDGEYQLVEQRILKDDCGLAKESGLFATGRLLTTGDVVSFAYAFFDMQLVGFYLEATERWRADGNVENVSWTVNEKACRLDEIRMSLEATAKTKRRFVGTFSLTTHTPRAPECVCEFWAGYEATRL